MYTPKPVDTGSIDIPDGVLERLDEIAEQIHEVWAKNRVEQGWTYGAERSDTGRTHPCLVAYSELPEAEKQYDRDTAITALKMLAALGYRIERN